MGEYEHAAAARAADWSHAHAGVGRGSALSTRCALPGQSLPAPPTRPCLPPALQFISEFFTYEPLADPGRPPTHLVSPWSLLEWQASGSAAATLWWGGPGRGGGGL